jgi:hypothetical protein
MGQKASLVVEVEIDAPVEVVKLLVRQYRIALTYI